MSRYPILKSPLVKATAKFVKSKLIGAEGGHDWFHIQRVLNNALHIGQNENANMEVVAISALLHDIADSKFHEGDESIGPEITRNFLNDQQAPSEFINHVIQIIEHISFKNSLEPGSAFESKELFVVRDADRLDAIGAIGIARCFNYGGFKNRPLYDPEIEPNLNMSKAEYKASSSPTINHFYEKLLLLKDKMHTETGRALADQRHDYMKGYLDQFFDEWNGKK